MNPKYQAEYDEWHREVSQSQDIHGQKDSLGGAWAPFVSSSYTPNLITWLCSVFPIRNVIDVGCGSGEALRAFRMHGCQVLGIEGLHAAAKLTDVPTVVHNIENGPLIIHNIDLAFSIEFVEHVVPDKIDNVIKTLVNGKMIVMSHAIENQPGHHHVNCQPAEYWIEHFKARGYRYLEELSHFARTLDCGYFRQSGMIFLRDDVDWGTFVGNYKER